MNVANVGPGDFHLRWHSDRRGGRVFQHIHRINGQTLRYPLDDVAFEYHSGSDHDHFHVNDWAILRLLDDTASCDVHPNDRSPGCVVAEGEKISYCLTAQAVFDWEISEEFGAGISYRCDSLDEAQGVP